MRDSISAIRDSDPVRSLDQIRPTQAKAGLRPSTESDGVGSSDPIGLIAKTVVLTHYGTVKEAAYALGQVDPSLMQRELEAGNLRRIEVATDAAVVKAKLAEALHTAYAPLRSPEARVRQLIREIRVSLDELDSYIDLRSR